jgi:hypothetical protein
VTVKLYATDPHARHKRDRKGHAVVAGIDRNPDVRPIADASEFHDRQANGRG